MAGPRAWTTYLALINLLCAVISLLQNVVVVRWLGSVEYGIVALVVAFNAVAANFVDLRLSDLIARLYFRPQQGEEIAQYRSSVIQIGLSLQFILAIALAFIGSLLTVTTLNVFTDAEVTLGTVLAVSAAQAMSYTAALLSYVQRFCERFGILGAVQLSNSILGALLVSGTVWLSPTVSGYAQGILLAAALSFVVAIASTIILFRKIQGLRLLYRFEPTAMTEYVKSIRFLFTMNFLGYIKLFHRAADVLVVGYFCDDRRTGLYKLARSLTDVLYTLFDAANKIYQPKFLVLLSEGRISQYRTEARHILMTALTITVGMIILELIFLPGALTLVFGQAFVEAAPAIVFLTLPFFFVCGLFLWIWPVLVFHGDVMRYTVFSAISVIVGQYVLGITPYVFTDTQDITWFAAGYAFSYFMLYALTALHLHVHHRHILPKIVPVGSGA